MARRLMFITLPAAIMQWGTERSFPRPCYGDRSGAAENTTSKKEFKMLGQHPPSLASPAAAAPRGQQRSRATLIAQQQLEASPYSALQDICCEGHDGHLILRGRVPSFYLKQLAQELVRPIQGVRSVVNRLEVDPPGATAGGG
jgi:osmotically-inducible protein OsmY